MTILVNNEDVNYARKLSFLFHILVSPFHIEFSYADTNFTLTAMQCSGRFLCVLV